MLIPYDTDAAIYHRPYATVGLIIANTVAFLLVLAIVEVSPEFVEQLILQYGHGLRPWQWVTSNFVHGSWMHLIGNMFCLWGFGIVVEGKIGWWRMLVVFLAIGVMQCAVEQSMMLFAGDGGSLGASAVIYGLLAMCLVWAPENEMNCVLLFGPPRLIEMKLSAIAALMFFLEFATGLLSGMTIGSQVLHLMGGAVGFGVAVFMLRRKWVDCEGWDLFSVLKDRPQKQAEEDRDAVRQLLDEAHKKRIAALDTTEYVAAVPPAKMPVAATTVATASPPRSGIAGQPAPARQAIVQPAATVDPQRQAIHTALRTGDPAAAFRAYEIFAADPLNFPPPEQELLRIIAAFHQQKRWSDSIPAMVEYLQYHSRKAAQVRLKLGHILLEAEKRPAQALHVLGKLRPQQLSPAEQESLAKLLAAAKQRRQTTRNEPAVEDW